MRGLGSEVPGMSATPAFLPIWSAAKPGESMFEFEVPFPDLDLDANCERCVVFRVCARGRGGSWGHSDKRGSNRGQYPEEIPSAFDPEGRLLLPLDCTSRFPVGEGGE